MADLTAGREKPAEGVYCPPPWVALCPCCKGLLEFQPDAWEERDGRWFVIGGDLSCTKEDEDDPEDTHDYSMPYVTWLPVEVRVLRWLNREAPR